jgi:hypothetical protein
MKKRLHLFTLVAMISMVACNNEEVADAKIFERKEQEGNRLMIKYNYTVDGKQYLDSAEIDNIVLEGDVIPVKYEKSNPQKAFPQLEK